MTDQFQADRLRDLLKEIDSRLADAERLRNHVRDADGKEPHWPERRIHSRVLARGDEN